MNRKQGTIIAALLAIPLLMGLGAGVGIVVVTQLGFVESSNTDESEKSSNISESENSITPSDPEEFYIGKDTKGSKVYIKPEDVNCEVDDDNPTNVRNRRGVFCKSNGYILTLTDIKLPHSNSQECARTDHQSNIDGVWVDVAGNNDFYPDSFTCIAAKKYGKYQPF